MGLGPERSMELATHPCTELSVIAWRNTGSDQSAAQSFRLTLHREGSLPLGAFSWDGSSVGAMMVDAVG